MGNAETFPYVATTYSITELLRHWTMMLAFSRGALGHRALFPVALGLLLHATAAIILLLAILVHIYMAFWVKGSITGMIEGRVSRRWAKKHHPRWYREVEAQEDKQRQ